MHPIKISQYLLVSASHVTNIHNTDSRCACVRVCLKRNCCWFFHWNRRQLFRRHRTTSAQSVVHDAWVPWIYPGFTTDMTPSTEHTSIGSKQKWMLQIGWYSSHDVTNAPRLQCRVLHCFHWMRATERGSRWNGPFLYSSVCTGPETTASPCWHSHAAPPSFVIHSGSDSSGHSSSNRRRTRPPAVMAARTWNSLPREVTSPPMSDAYTSEMKGSRV